MGQPIERHAGLPRNATPGRGAGSRGAAAIAPERLRASAERLHSALASLSSAQGAVPLGELRLGDALIPLKALRAAEELLRRQAAGQDPEVLVLDAELTAPEAARLLGVSRTHLNALLDRERIAHVKTSGGHRRIPASAILDYRRRRETAHEAMGDAMRAGALLAEED